MTQKQKQAMNKKAPKTPQNVISGVNTPYQIFANQLNEQNREA